MLAAHAAGIEFRHKAFSLSDLMSGACSEQLKQAKAPMFKSVGGGLQDICLLYTSPSPRDRTRSRMPSSA